MAAFVLVFCCLFKKGKLCVSLCVAFKWLKVGNNRQITMIASILVLCRISSNLLNVKYLSELKFHDSFCYQYGRVPIVVSLLYLF